MDHDKRVVWLFNDVAEVEGFSWCIQIWAIAHYSGFLVWSERLILWDDDEWHVMIEWVNFRWHWWLSQSISGSFHMISEELTWLCLMDASLYYWLCEISKYDVRGCGQMMGDHHFRSLFTLSPLHIELPIVSPLSLTRARSPFFHHLIYLLHWVGDHIVLTCYDWIRHEF